MLRAAARPQPEGLKTAMSALTPYASTALGAGVACLSLGATRRIDTGWKAFGLVICALASSAAPAHADPHVDVTSVVQGKCVSIRVCVGGRRHTKTKQIIIL